MYAGRVVEEGAVRALFASRGIPTRRACWPACRAVRRGRGARAAAERLFAIRGQVSSPLAPPPGCAFEPRCDLAMPACRGGHAAAARTPAAPGALHPRAGTLERA